MAAVGVVSDSAGVGWSEADWSVAYEDVLSVYGDLAVG